MTDFAAVRNNYEHSDFYDDTDYNKYTNFIEWNGYKDDKESKVGYTPPEAVEFFKKAIEKYGPGIVNVT